MNHLYNFFFVCTISALFLSGCDKSNVNQTAIQQENLFAIFNYGVVPMRLHGPFICLSVDGSLSEIHHLPESAKDRMWYVYTTNDSCSNDGIVGEFDLNKEEFSSSEGELGLCGLYLASTNPNLQRSLSASLTKSAMTKLLSLHERTMSKYIRKHEYFPVGPNGSEIQTHRCQMNRDFVHLVKCPDSPSILAVIVSSGTQEPIESGLANTGIDAAHIYVLPSLSDSWRFAAERRYALLFDLDADGTVELITHHFGKIGGVFSFHKFQEGRIRTLAVQETR